MHTLLGTEYVCFSLRMIFKGTKNPSKNSFKIVDRIIDEIPLPRFRFNYPFSIKLNSTFKKEENGKRGREVGKVAFLVKTTILTFSLVILLYFPCFSPFQLFYRSISFPFFPPLPFFFFFPSFTLCVLSVVNSSQ